MGESKTVINIEEFIGKTVGRRRPPVDPMKMGFAMQSTQVIAILCARS